MGLESLSREFSWPDEKPGYNPDPHGWLTESSKQLMQEHLPEQREMTIVELGVWLGKSLRFMADAAPDATLIAIDTWDGSTWMRDQGMRKLDRLYDTFLVNCWEMRDRIIPIRKDSMYGLMKLREHGVVPDVVHIDAEHTYFAVRGELVLVRALWPNALIIGDDLLWKNPQRKVHDNDQPVKRAVTDFVRETASEWRSLRSAYVIYPK